MKKITQNSFGKGLNMDLNPLTTPKDVLTDCLNGTVITYNGDEFSLQTEMGNSKVIVSGSGENALPEGFIPLGIKEFNNILYIVAHNPITKESRIGSFPSPQRYIPMQNSDTENKVIKTIWAENGSSIWELTEGMETVGYVDHGMNTLNSYLNIGDKYRTIIKIGNANTPWSEAEGVLQKFINNYGTTSDGYFDLKYYTYNSDGTYIELPINITPGDSSDIEYFPRPTFTDINGTTKINTVSGNSVIVAALIPKNIKSFNFRLQGYNSGGLKAKVVFDSDLVKDTNSAVKLTTVKIVTKNSEFSGETINYYDYATYGDGNPVIIEKLVDGISTSFIVGTIITTTCTPIDQFGREMLYNDNGESLVITKTYEVTSLLLGTAGHNLFRYKIVGSNLTLNYNFLNEGIAITETQVEFYDFWSGVSVLTPLIPFTVEIDKEVTLILPVASLPKTQIFDSTQKGGVLVSSLRAPVAGENTLASYITNSPLRTNHCYLVRIFGTDGTVDLSVFQLLYTLPIAEFTGNYDIVDNFGILDIANGISVNTLKSTHSGNIFGNTPIAFTPTSPLMVKEEGNYTKTGISTSEAYRLYGGPVFEEERDGVKASWINGNRYYRNVYTKGFEKEEKNLTPLGYHNFPESSIRYSLSADSPYGTSLPVTLFTDLSKNYLKGGLVAPGTNSQKDFRFAIVATMSVTAPTISGSVIISPETIVGPVFFGSIDMAMLNKKIKLGSYTSPTVVNLDSIYNLSPSNITENITWSVPTMVSPGVPAHTAKLRIELVSGDDSDTMYIKDFELQSERFTYGDSGFKYYRHKSPKNKLFSYFSLNHTQTVKIKLNDIYEISDVTKYQEYLFSGEIDQNYDVEFENNNTIEDKAYSQYSMVTALPMPPPFDAKLIWTSTPTSFDLVSFVSQIGNINLGVASADTTYTNTNASTNSTRTLLFAKDLTYPGQYLYNAFKWPTPVQFKIRTGVDSTDLSTYNNLWRWSDSVDSYVALEDNFSRDYLDNLILYQTYQEIVVAQYPKTNFCHNTASTSNVTITSNNLQYFINSSLPDAEKHLTKTCFGTGVLEPFTIAKFSSIISKWHENNISVSKLIYDFTDINISEGYAKNIPWNISDGLISTISIANLSLTLDTQSPQAHVNLFSNAENAVNLSNYLVNSTTSPFFKIIHNSQAVDMTTSFFAVENTLDSYSNINASSSLVIPVFNKSLVLTRTTTIPTTYGIKYKMINPPTLEQLYGGFNVKIGDYFGGGVVIKLNTDLSTGKITGGLIGAVSNGTITPAWIPKSYFYESLSGGQPYSTGATSITDGWNNTQKLLLNPRSSQEAARYCVNYRGGGFTDWYMPSQEELRVFLAFSKTHAAALPVDEYYWSSTEFSWDRAVMCYRLGNGTTDVRTHDKNNYLPVIPIRKF